MSPPLSSIAYIYFTISSTFTLIPSIIMTLKNLFKTRKSGVGWGYRTRKSRVGWGHRSQGKKLLCGVKTKSKSLASVALSSTPIFFSFLFFFSTLLPLYLFIMSMKDNFPP
uniref:Uncharacterized protein n=1 Tax=Cacopsylla melanoneura TaxID=428564 RepID=A0A8D9BKW5_9HEMI